MRAIEVHGVRKRFGDVVALDGIVFGVDEATVFGLLGPNGAGKTTAVRVLATVIRPDAGSASVLGHDVVTHPQTVRRAIGLAGQYAAIDPNLTGVENLRMVGRLAHMTRADANARAVELLGRFGLSDAGGRPAKTYSGGMRRRLDLAAALVHRPRVLFLDEPTTGLDPQSRSSLWDTIRELVADGTTVLLTTQYLEEADRLASQVAVVDHGRVIAHDTPAALKSSFGSTVIEVGFADEAKATKAAEVMAKAEPDGSPERDGALVRLSSPRGADALMDVLRALDRSRVRPATLTVREPSLDDVFLALTGHKAAADMPAEPGRKWRRA